MNVAGALSVSGHLRPRLTRLLLLALLLVLLGTAARPLATPTPDAPECPTHNPYAWHGLWNAAQGCHYDHEHGADPTAFVSPFDIPSYLGGTWIASAYPTSPAEPTVKHGGFKWTVVDANPNGCTAGFEGAANCVKSAAVQIHAFGNLAVELLGRVHSVMVFEQVCVPGGACGWLFAVAHVDYGQRVAPYQGTVIPFPDNPQPSYPGGFGPYWSADCTGPWPGCRGVTLGQWRALGYSASSVVSNKPTGGGVRPAEPILVRLLWRVRDNYQTYDSASGDFRYLCGDAVYDPAGCKYNNSTGRVHELGGEVPAAWDGDEYDSDPRVGFVSRTGMLDGLPYQLLGVPVGKFGSVIVAGKPSNPNAQTNPERDVCFSVADAKRGVVGGQVVNCDVGGVPSGWIGANN